MLLISSEIANLWMTEDWATMTMISIAISVTLEVNGYAFRVVISAITIFNSPSEMASTLKRHYLLLRSKLFSLRIDFILVGLNSLLFIDIILMQQSPGSSVG